MLIVDVLDQLRNVTNAPNEMIPLARYDFSINWSVGGIRNKLHVLDVAIERD